MRRSETIGLLVLLAGALLLRVWSLRTAGLWLDEGHSMEIVWTSGQGVLDGALEQNKPPLYFFVLWGWIQLFGTSELAARSLAALFGTATVVAVFLFARRRLGIRAAFAAAALCAVAPLEIVYAQQIRYYTLLGLLGLLGLWALLAADERPTLRHFGAWTALAVAMIYTHSTGVLMVAAQGAIAIGLVIFPAAGASHRRPPLARRWGASFVIVALAAAPWLWHSLQVVGGDPSWYAWMQQIWPGAPPAWAVGDSLLNLASAGGESKLHGLGRPGLAAVIAGVAVIGCAIVPFIARIHETDAEPPEPPLRRTCIALAAWLLIPLLLQLVYSHLFFNIYLPGRSDAALLPGLMLLAGAGLGRVRLPSSSSRVLRPGLITILVVGVAASTLTRHHARRGRASKSRDRLAAEQMGTRLDTKRDLVILAGPIAPTMTYYLKRSHPRARLLRYPERYGDSPYLRRKPLPPGRFRRETRRIDQAIRAHLRRHARPRIAIVIPVYPIPSAVRAQYDALLRHLAKTTGAQRAKILDTWSQSGPAYISRLFRMERGK